MKNLTVYPGGTLHGVFRVPGDKSISHRAMILGSIAEGKTLVQGFLEGQDCLATLKVMQQMGVSISRPSNETVEIEGVGLHGLKAPKALLDCGNSGTSIRLLAGLLSAQPFSSTLIGDASLSKRPMERVTLPLKKMGAQIEGEEVNGRILPPLRIQKADQLQAIEYTLPVASAQVKSCLLLAGLYAKNASKIIEPHPTRDHTERMLYAFGADLKINGHEIILQPGQPLMGQTMIVPGDISSAAFFIAGACLLENAHITIQQVGVNPRRIGVIEILKAMGANIQLRHERILNGEPVADIEVKGTPLHGIDVPAKWVANAIDEFPVLFIVGAFAKGETVLRGAKELRFKETDRIETMARGLRALGADVEVFEDGLAIRGGQLQGGKIHSGGDHRVAMAFAMASLKAQGEIEIEDCDNIATSFPNFVTLAKSLGLLIKE